MTGTPDISGDKIGVGETVWYQTNINRERSAVDGLSERAELCFYRLRTHYIWRAGNLPYDPAGICTKMGYKTIRSFNPGFDELVQAGVVKIEDGMIRFPYADVIIAEVQAGRDKKAKFGALGGEGRNSAYAGASKGVQEEHERNTAGVPPETENGNQQNQRFSESKKTTTNHQPESKNPPPTPSPAHGGGGGSEIHQIIAGFDQRIVSYWGLEAKRDQSASEDAHFAGLWLAKAQGSVEAVLNAIDDEMEKERTNNRRPPGSLKAYRVSVPAQIGQVRSAKGSASNGYPTAGPSSSAATPIWTEIRKLATRNWHDDIAAEIRRTAEKEGDEAANSFARSMEALVSRKKARAAA